MNKLILTLEILNGVSNQDAFNHGIALAQAAFQVANPDLVNPFVGIEVKDERASAAVQVGPLPYDENAPGYTRIVRQNRWRLNTLQADLRQLVDETSGDMLDKAEAMLETAQEIKI